MTGRYLILLGPDETAAAQSHLNDTAGLSLQSVGGSEALQIDELSIAEGQGIVFHELGVAVVNSPPDQIAAVNSAVAQSSALYAMEPERYVHTYGSIDLTYLRGYRDAVNHLYDTMTGAGPSDSGLGGRMQEISYDESQLSWGLQATRVPDSRFTGRGVKVPVLDTGLDLTHPDFTGRTIVSQSFIAGQGVQDGNGHGTHCCGVAVGARRPQHLPRYGIAYDADLYVGKVLDNSGRGTDAGIIAGLQWALSHNCDVISLSLGSAVERGQAYSAVFQQIAERALARGSLIVAAAGNDSDRARGKINPVSHPANCPDIFSVAAVDRALKTAWFSNAGLNPGGGKIDLAAPGMDVMASWPAPDLYKALDGTSMAAPHAAGIAALFLEAAPQARGRSLWAYLMQRAKPLSADSKDVGAGLVQAPLA
ncbi:S8 family serine peptidase [Methylobacterium sp. 10]|uniref:S8 family serine peptidase n=1 Tax=Methylobacterium sp. 10 TaxID=1101191 RepID=UPI0018CC30EE|nr:S8 family serine peptidase [Methylobacterium sp. 10]